jgi:hypothetical protein
MGVPALGRVGVMRHPAGTRRALPAQHLGRLAGLVLILGLMTTTASAQSAYLMIVVGLAGDPEHGEMFKKWGATLASTSEKLGVPGERVLHLDGQTTRAQVEKAFDTIAKTATADDSVFIVLIGHGSYDGRTARFNLSGPDMAAADFEALLRRLPSKHVAFVNTASASGPFVEELKAPGRAIVTATRSGSEQFATLFGGYFVDAFSTEAADSDKNGRVSLSEAYEFARAEVARAYEREGLLATEHALLEDPGKMAPVLSLGSTRDSAALPADPRLRELYTERRELERRMEALKLLKGGMDTRKYLSELETVATALARKNAEIRTAEAKP